MADVLGQARKGLDKDFRGSPPVRASLLNAIGRTYMGLGLAAEAEEALAAAVAVLERALGPDHPATLGGAATWR